MARATAQQVQKQFLFHIPDTLFPHLNHLTIAIDRNGGYSCSRSGDSAMILTAQRTYGPFTYGSTVNGAVYTNHKPDKKNLSKYEIVTNDNVEFPGQYFQIEDSSAVFGPIDGKVEVEYGSNGKRYVYTIAKEDTIGYYVNGVHVRTVSRGAGCGCGCGYGRAVFSAKNVLLAIPGDKYRYLYFNTKLVDSSINDYSELAVDDMDNYRYSLDDRSGRRGEYGELLPLLHSRQQVIGPVCRTGSVFAAYNDERYYYGNINNLLRTPGDTLTIRPERIIGIVGSPGGMHFIRGPQYGLLQYDAILKRSASIALEIDGERRVVPYGNIFLPCIDTGGNYAFIGERDYYLYKNINGIEQRETITRHGVRGVPICMDTKGNVICYFLTDDSAYVYQNDRLFIKCAIEQFSLDRNIHRVFSLISIGQYSYNGYDKSIFYAGDHGYIVYNNSISPPMLKPGGYQVYEGSETGDYVCGSENDYGFWVVQKTGEHTYDLIINNRRIPLPPGVMFEGPLLYTLCKNYRLSEKEFVFYVLQERSVFRYIIPL